MNNHQRAAFFCSFVCYSVLFLCANCDSDVFTITTGDEETLLFSTSTSSPPYEDFMGSSSTSTISEYDLSSSSYSYDYSVTEETSEPLDPSILLSDHCNDTNNINKEDFMVTNKYDGENRTFSINVFWSVPENASDCNFEYNVCVNKDVWTKTKNTSVSIANVYSCRTYSIGIQLIYNGSIKGTTETIHYIENNQALFQELTVNDLTIMNLNTTAWNVSWKEPDPIVSHCVTSYFLAIWTNDSSSETKSFTVPKDQTSYILSPLIPCLEYTIEIYGKVDDRTNGNNKMINQTAPPNPTHAPLFENATHSNISLTLGWQVDNSSVNQCPFNYIEMECEALPNKNHNLSWIIKKSSSTSSTSIPKTNNEYELLAKDLSPFTNYTCRSRTLNSGGLSNWSEPQELQTDPGVASEPQKVEIVEITSTSFTFKWSLPEKIPSAFVDYYGVEITNEGPNYTPNNTCTLDLQGVIDKVTSTELVYTYKTAMPYYNYTIVVYAMNVAGRGNNSLPLTITTKPEPPEKPARFIIEDPKSMSDSYYDIIQPISWIAPCKINGHLSHFIVSWEGKYNSNLSKHSTDHEIDQNNETIQVNPLDVYEYSIKNVKASYSYKVAVYAVLQGDIDGNATTGTFVTWDGYVPAPTMKNVSAVTDSGFLVSWMRPVTSLAKIVGYNVTIEAMEALYDIPQDCPPDKPNYSRPVGGEILEYQENEALPFYQYQTFVFASTAFGTGHESTKQIVTTKAAAPEEVRHSEHLEEYNQSSDIYNANALITFKPPCRLNDIFSHYSLTLFGKRAGLPNHEEEFKIKDGFNHRIELKPDFEYDISVTVVTENFKRTKKLPTFKARGGVPTLVKDRLQNPISSSPHKAFFNLNKHAFNDTNGIVRYYSILLARKPPGNTRGYGFWDGKAENWPNSTEFYRLTPPMWNPFKNGSTGDSALVAIDKFNDQPLTENSEYFLVVRAFTDGAYRETEFMRFSTQILDELDLGLILGLTFGLLLLCALTIFIVMLWRRRKTRDNNVIHVSSVNNKYFESPASSINCKQFLTHYQNIRDDSNIIKNQFGTLQKESQQIALPSLFATLPENKRKNRYTNILPYDDTRVKLIIDEDDEIASDYINASYLKGYSGNVEYIATQGPLLSTCSDFWKMIIQENVTIIVMVSQFIEQNKEKCFHYFPNNHERVAFGKYEVKCLTELHFGTYCVRTLSVSKDTVEHSLIHMQFLEWPDFGVPSTTESMLQFCCQMRERVRVEGGLIVVHCSAGVGRTGTLIATDVLLQTIDDHRDIDVYKTVLDLRTQRAKMVQTEAQYKFIYDCLKDALEDNAKPCLDGMSEPLYENMAAIRASSMEKNLIQEESPL